jgi:hypothetical protein
MHPYILQHNESLHPTLRFAVREVFLWLPRGLSPPGPPPRPPSPLCFRAARLVSKHDASASDAALQASGPPPRPRLLMPRLHRGITPPFATKGDKPAAGSGLPPPPQPTRCDVSASSPRGPPEKERERESRESERRGGSRALTKSAIYARGALLHQLYSAVSTISTVSTI